MHDLLVDLAGTGIRPEEGLQVVSLGLLTRRPVDPSIALLLLPTAQRARTRGDSHAFDPEVLPGRAARGTDAAELLRALYPPDHPVLGLAGAGDAVVGTVTTGELEEGAHALPALPELLNVASPHGLPWLAARLRAPDGCPWDREQTHQSLRKFLLEEAYEVYDALESDASPALAEELGDLLLQVVLHAHYAAESGIFDLTDVYRSIMTKIVRRHPHVFGDVRVSSAADVTRNWEQIKADERASRVTVRGDADRMMPAAFAGLSRSLPALAYAQEMQERAASLGYDWPDVEGVIDKIEEEAVELLGATDPAERREEFGDLLFAVVSLGRKLGLDSEAALRVASRKFAARFARVERLAGDRGIELRALGLGALDELWEEAKREERAPTGTR